MQGWTNSVKLTGVVVTKPKISVVNGKRKVNIALWQLSQCGELNYDFKSIKKRKLFLLVSYNEEIVRMFESQEKKCVCEFVGQLVINYEKGQSKAFVLIQASNKLYELSAPLDNEGE